MTEREAHVGHTILVVDDDDELRDALTADLTAGGFEVRAAWAEDTLRHLRSGFRPCVVVADLRMPGMDGWALIDRMQADPELAAIAIVVLSGDASERERAQRLGVREVLRKPVEPGSLHAVVRRHCGR